MAEIPADIKFPRINPKGDAYFRHIRDGISREFKIEDDLYLELSVFNPSQKQDWWRAQILRINQAIDAGTAEDFEFNLDGLPTP